MLRDKDWLRRRALTREVFLPLAIQLAEVLARLHERHVIHRDLSPMNVVVADDEHLTLVDFDAAVVTGPADGAVPAQLGGALPYVAPEETGRMNRGVDHRADLYSLGAMLYEMLVGAPPSPRRIRWSWCTPTSPRRPRRRRP